ncbi:MAG: thiosulfohydrolase SoxB [Betaproteobacteria bacterium]|nr:thiosulfohydrolase SoxB [Betaproteobacteria bacterium]
MTRREFLQALAAAAAAGMALDDRRVLAGGVDWSFYDLPRFGNVHLLHITDVHAQLDPVFYREPGINIGVGSAAGRPPHLVGEALLRHFGIDAGTRNAHAFTCLDYVSAARRYGRMGGFAHLATLVGRLRAGRPDALLLDGGDSWQGSATALWSRGEDMVEASLELGVDVMTGHWEFTYGADRVRELIDGPMKDRIAFVAQNVRTRDFGDEVFPAYVRRECNGIPVAVIGQAFPYTPIANPGYLIPDWTFGIREAELQKTIDAVRAAGARVVVLLSHNGMDVDLKLASRVTGLDAILGGHTHDAVPAAIEVRNASGVTIVTNAGSNGKFLGVLDLDVRGSGVRGYRYRLLPVFSDLLPPDASMQTLIERERAPHAQRLAEPLAVTEDLLYRRGNFNGTFDQVILDALMAVEDVEVAFSPGFRWGTTLLPGDTITRGHLMEQTAITYPHVTVREMTGARMKAAMEDVADNLFHPDPYYQQGGDMVRVGGMTYTCAPHAAMGDRIRDMRVGGQPVDPGRTYKVASWAPVTEGATGEPVWKVVETYLRDRRRITGVRAYVPRLVGVEGDPGIGCDGGR